jgi:transcriptional regulator with XRE-family HTH domain
MDFWVRFKAKIKAHNTTQEWVAEQIGVPLSTLRKWMSRKTYPNIKKGVEIAILLETSAEFLVTGSEQELNVEERELIVAYRKLSPEDKVNTLLAINAWASKNEHPLL